MAFLLLASPAVAQNHLEDVKGVRRTLTAQKVIPAGIVNPDNTNPCGVFEITKRVAWLLKGEGAGLLEKTSGNNCKGYSMDFVVYPDGRSADIAVGGEFDGVVTDAAPAWNLEMKPEHIARWRPAIDPGDGPFIPPDHPVPPDVEPLPANPELMAKLDELSRKLEVVAVDVHYLVDTVAATNVNLNNHMAIEEAHWERVKGIWESTLKPTVTFISKYILPAVGGWLIAHKVQ